MGKMRQFRRMIRSCVNKPLLFDGRDGYGAVVGAMAERIARGLKVHDAEIAEIMGATGPDLPHLEPKAGEDDVREPQHITIAAGPTLIPNGAGGKVTALVPMHGVALYDLEYQPYAFSTLLLAQTMNALANDPAVGTIILDIDSPGGMVTGTAEAGDAIYAAAKRKNVVALVNPLAASAAYWLASQAREIISIKSADIGSIGVYMAHTDCSKFNEQQGMNITYIYAGEFKTEGNPNQPLSAAAIQYYQAEVDVIYADFLKAVARGRKTSVQDVLDNFGKGRVMSAVAAKKCGMIDDFMTIDMALAHCGVAQMPSARGRRGEDESPTQEAQSTAVEPPAPEEALPAETPDATDPHVQHQINEMAESETTDILTQMERIRAAVEAPGPDVQITAMELRVDEDGKAFLVGDAPRRTAFSREIVDHGRGKYLTVTGKNIQFNLDDGILLYKKDSEDENGNWICSLVSRSQKDPAEDAEKLRRSAEAETRRRRLEVLKA